MTVSLPLLLLALVVLSFSPAVALQPGEDLTITSVQGSGSCSNTGLVALNCTSPFTLTLTVVNITGLPLSAYSFYLEIDFLTFWYDPAVSNTTSSSIVFAVSTRQFQLVTGLLLNLSLVDVRDYSAVVRTPQPTPGFSLAYVPLPQVLSVSGCQPTGNPLFTSNCIPEMDVLTLQGSGFTGLSSVSCTLSQPGYGYGSSTITLYVEGGALVLVNDSVLLMPLTELRFLSQAQHFDGRILSMLFRFNSRYQTNQWNITMAYLPPPAISSYSVYGVQPVLVSNVTTFPNCVPGVNAITLYGQFLFWTNITVGGAVCNNRISSNTAWINQPTQVGCTLPIVEPDLLGAMYDVVFNGTQGTVLTLPGIIGFTAQPSIASVAPCWSDGGYFTWNIQTARCLPGETLTVYGRHFLAPGFILTNVTIDSWSSSAGPLSFCTNLSVISDSALTCVLPAEGSGEAMDAAYLQTTWNGNYSTNQLTASIFDFPTAPRILSVSGCGQSSDLSSGLSLSGCQPAAVITLSGFNLAATSALFDVFSLSSSSTGFTSFYCAPLSVLSNETATCSLPDASEDVSLLYYTPYRVLMVQRGSGWPPVSSNYFSISLAPAASSASSPSSTPSLAPSSTPFPTSSSASASGGGGGGSGSSATVPAVASVLSVVAVLLLVGAGCWLWRRRVQRGASKDAGASWTSGDSSETIAGGWQSFGSAGADSSAGIELTDG